MFSTLVFLNIYSYFISVQFDLLRMERQRREEELKNRSSKKGHEAEQAILNRVGCLSSNVYEE